ncbi:hypothetical protein BDW22DRAFT_533207 [Trametopsis cervina]|nr:hypothetical protein BDW22DRAFT_533207 [Trametopsis cervina]
MFGAVKSPAVYGVEMVALRRAPEIYEPLVIILEAERVRGNTRVLFHQLGIHLKQHGDDVYTKAGCKRLGDYVRMAMEAEVVFSEPVSDSAQHVSNHWVALHPRYHGKAPEPVE